MLPSTLEKGAAAVGERKLMSEAEAVRRFVADGDTVYAGYVAGSFGLVHEIIRQGRRGLELVGASVGVQGNLLIPAGCVDRVRTGYLGAALRPGVAQEMIAAGELRVEDYSNQSIALMLMAGALGLPFIPTRSFLGTDYLAPEFADHTAAIPGYRKFAQIDSPFDGRPVALLPAIRPDVAILHAQRADEEGNTQVWGHQGDARWGYWAAKKLIVSAEAIVPRETIAADPSRTVVPGFRVSAVVHMPLGGHPGGLAGHYDYDYAFQARTMNRITRSREGWQAFADEWVYGVPDRAGYVAQYREVFGDAALDFIRPDAGPHPAPGVSYEYATNLRFRM